MFYTATRQLSQEKAESRRSWYRHLFYDHPDYSQTNRPAESLFNQKTKIWCKRCFEALVLEEERRDGAQPGGIIRDRTEIEIALWARDKNATVRWHAATQYDCLHHLANCPHIKGSDVALRAALEHNANNLSPRRAAAAAKAAALREGRAIYPEPAVFAPQPTLGVPYMVAPPLGAPSTSQSTAPALQPLIMSGLPPATPFMNTPVSASSSPLSYYGLYPSPSPMSPSPSPASGSPLLLGHKRNSASGSPIPKRARTSRSASAQSIRALTPLSLPAWDEARVSRYETSLARLTASCGWPFTWVENPEWLMFCDEFIPGAPNPTRKVLTNRIVPSVLQNFRQIAQMGCNGALATLACDGLTARNDHHFVSFMITANRKVYTVRTYDTSLEPKTAENLLKMMIEVLDLVEKDWKASIIAVTTDCGGEARAARARLVRERPHLVGPDCYAHQVELIVHDYFKADATVFAWTKKADDIIRWLRSRKYLLSLLLDIQKNIPQQQGPPKTVIRGALTRWTSHYLAYRRLLELYPAILVLVEDPRIFQSGSAETHEKTREMIPIIKSPLLWHALLRVKRHLEPLAVAANIAQSNQCRLDDVVFIFGFLFKYFDTLSSDDLHDGSDSDAIRNTVKASLEKRWSRADQDVFVAAALLNPYLKTAPFRALHDYFSVAAVGDLMGRLWKRFYPSVPEPATLYAETKAYLAENRSYDNTITFEWLDSTRNRVRDQAAKRGEPPNPLDVWQDSLILDPSAGATQIPPLHQLAIRILSMCPNSADCERFFSTIGKIMSDLRTRLTNTNLLNLAELRLHLRDEHIRKNVKLRLKRHFGDRINAPSLDQVEPEPGEASTSNPHSAPSDPSRSEHLNSDREERITSLQRLVQHMAALNANDEGGGEDDDRIWGQVKIKIPLGQLFDFTKAFWTNWEHKFPHNTIDEELAVWDLLDMDADGEDDQQGQDEITQAALGA